MATRAQCVYGASYLRLGSVHADRTELRSAVCRREDICTVARSGIRAVLELL